MLAASFARAEPVAAVEYCGNKGSAISRAGARAASFCSASRIPGSP